MRINFGKSLNCCMRYQHQIENNHKDRFPKNILPELHLIKTFSCIASMQEHLVSPYSLFSLKSKENLEKSIRLPIRALSSVYHSGMVKQTALETSRALTESAGCFFLGHLSCQVMSIVMVHLLPWLKPPAFFKPF